MKMFLVLRNRLAGIERFIYVDQQVMVAAVRKLIARVSDAHPAQSKETPERTGKGRSVLG